MLNIAPQWEHNFKRRVLLLFFNPHKFLNYEENDFLFAVVCVRTNNQNSPKNSPALPTPRPTYMGGGNVLMGQTPVPPCLEASSDCDLICNPKFINPNCEGLLGDIWMPAYDLISCCAGPPNPSIYPSCHPFPGWDNIYRSPDYISEGLPTPSGDSKAMRMGTYFDETCPLSEGLITEVNVQPNKNYMLIYTRTGYGYPYLVGGGSGEPLMQLVELCSDCNSNYEGALAQSISRLYFRLTNAANIPWDLDADMMCNPALNPPTDFVTITPGGISNNSESFTESDLEANIIMGMPWRKNSLCFSTGTDDTWDRLYLYPEMDYLGAWFIIDEVRLYEDDFPTLPTDYYVCPGDAVTIGSSFCEDAASDIVFSWEVFDGSTWQPLTGETQPTLTIFPTLPVTLYRLTRTLQPYPTAPLLDGSSCVNTQVEITVHLTEPPVGEEINSPQELACCLQNTNFLIHQNSGGLTMVYDNMAYTVQNSGTWTNTANELVAMYGAPADGVLRLNVDIVIPRGITLDLSGISIFFGPQGRIIVEDGATLRLLSGTVLDGLPSCNVVWQGIRVVGPGNNNQRAILTDALPNYGYLDMTAAVNSQVKNAIIGAAAMFVPMIDVYDIATQIAAQQNELCSNSGSLFCQTLTPLVLQPATNSAASVNTAGGVIISQTGIIDNCFQGFNLSWYANTAPLGTIAARVEGTTFRCSNTGLLFPFNVLAGTTPFTTEACIYGEKYARLFIGNNNNFGTGGTFGIPKYGIRGLNVNSWTIDRNNFIACIVGASLAGNTFSAANSYTVRFNSFQDCLFALQAFGGKLNTVTNQITGLPGLLTVSFGIVAVRAQLNIYNDQINNTFAAIVLLNNSWTTNIVQECVMTDNRIGTWLIGDNDGTFLYCNQYIDETLAILLQDDTDNSILGMLDDQGNCSVISPQPADNVFVNSAFPDITSFIADGFVYSHRPVPALTPTIANFGGGTATAIPCSIDPFVNCSTWQEIPDGMVVGLDDERQKEYILLKKFWRYLLEDQDTTAAMALLNSVETDRATQLKIAIAMEQGNYSLSNNLVAALPNTQEELLHYKQLVQLETTLQQSSRTYLQLTPEEETLVRQIAATHTLAAMDARVILYTAYGEEIIFALPELPPIIADNIGNWYVHFKNQYSNNNTPAVAVYPNPTVGTQQVQIQITNIEPKQIQIYNSMGALVYENELHKRQTQLQISIQNWASGLYYYQLTDNNGATYTGKFVVSGK